MNHGSLFSGIGGFDLAAEWMGWNNSFHCEMDEFNRKVLNYHFKHSVSYENIKTTDFRIWRGKIDIITGGFPCQPFSTAGKRKGTEDDRYLWDEMLRAIREISPSWVVAENVRGLVNWSDGLVFEQVCADLENEGYQVTAFILPACGIGAPHRRERIWIIAYSSENRRKWKGARVTEEIRHKGFYKIRKLEGRFERLGLQRVTSNSNKIGFQGQRWTKRQSYTKQNKKTEKYRAFNEFQWATKPPICGGNDGIPPELDNITIPKWRKQSLMAYGNAIVPQVAYQIFKSIKEYEATTK